MEEKEFVVFWRDGKKQTIRGNTIANAFSNAGMEQGQSELLISTEIKHAKISIIGIRPTKSGNRRC